MELIVNNFTEYVDKFLAPVYSANWYGCNDERKISIVFGLPIKYPCLLLSYTVTTDDEQLGSSMGQEIRHSFRYDDDIPKPLPLKSKLNLGVIENFILHITHSSDKEDDDEMTFTPALLYKMAEDYIEEDHVDGKPADNEQ